MKKCYILLILLIFGYSIKSQVGINTNNPKSTLHLQKKEEITFADGIIPPRISGDSLRLKEAAYTPQQNGAIVYVTSPATTTGPKTVGVISKGIFIYDAFANNGSGTGLWNVLPEGPVTPSTNTGDGAYASRSGGDLSLLNLSLTLSGSTLNFLRLPTASNSTPGSFPIVDVVNTSNITNTTAPLGGSYYTVPANGIYQINYSFRLGSGINLSLLGSVRPGIVITSSTAGTTTINTTNTVILDRKEYGGVASLVNTSAISEGRISHLYTLTAGQQLRFGTISSPISINLLSDAFAEISIYRIK